QCPIRAPCRPGRGPSRTRYREPFAHPASTSPSNIFVTFSTDRVVYNRFMEFPMKKRSAPRVFEAGRRGLAFGAEGEIEGHREGSIQMSSTPQYSAFGPGRGAMRR